MEHDDGGHDGRALVSRRIAAPATVIFGILCDPAQHPDVDGTGMLREGAPSSVIVGVGDVFAMKMHHPELGDYEMNNHVVVFEANRRIGWEPTPGHGHPAEDEWQSARPGYRWGFELTPDGADGTIVREYFDSTNASEELRTAVDGGKVWIDGMTKSLAQLDERAVKAVAGSAR
jgi:hypothetical protein